MKLALPLFARWVLRWEETGMLQEHRLGHVLSHLCKITTLRSLPAQGKTRSHFPGKIYILLSGIFLNKRTSIIIYYIKSKYWKGKVNILVGKIITVSYLSPRIYLLYLTLSSLWWVCISKKVWGINLFLQRQRMPFLYHVYCFLNFFFFF